MVMRLSVSAILNMTGPGSYVTTSGPGSYATPAVKGSYASKIVLLVYQFGNMRGKRLVDLAVPVTEVPQKKCRLPYLNEIQPPLRVTTLNLWTAWVHEAREGDYDSEDEHEGSEVLGIKLRAADTTRLFVFGMLPDSLLLKILTITDTVMTSAVSKSWLYMSSVVPMTVSFSYSNANAHCLGVLSRRFHGAHALDMRSSTKMTTLLMLWLSLGFPYATVVKLPDTDEEVIAAAQKYFETVITSK